MRETARPNCHTLDQSHLTPGNTPTVSDTRCRRPHCILWILPARDLKAGVCFWPGLFLKDPGTLSSCNKYTVKSADKN
jgi:hypothetical protein